MNFNIILFAQYIFIVSGCIDVQLLPELERRARNYKADGLNDPYINDYVLTDQWFNVYKVEQQYLMPDSNKMPDHFSCGGYEPVYIQGTHPDPETLSETPVNAVACLRSTFDDCDFTYDIQIRKCEERIQYFLVSTKQQSAYCFDPPSLQNDDGNFSPPPTDVSIGNVMVIPSLQFIQENVKLVINGESVDTINFTPYIKFTCQFNQQADYFYAVNWYFNGNVFRIRGPTQTLQDLTLDEKTFTDDKIPLGFTLKCGVRVLQDATGHSTQFIFSPDHFVGIKVLNHRIDLPKDGEGTVQLQLTVPLGCRYNDATENPACSLGVSMFDPVGYRCESANVAQVKNSHVCGQDIKGLKMGQKWDPEEVFYFNVTTIDEDYNDRLDFTLQLRTDSEYGHKWWTKYQADNVQVVVNDRKVYKDKVCYSRVDPHMKTADGYHYENQNKGEFLLYRNTKYNIEVLEKTNRCNRNRALCTCGLIIRAGADVFAINLCNNVRFSEFLSCENGGILKVVVKERGHRYQIFTPIGTWVDAKLHGVGTYSGFMNVDIMMAPKDLEQTEGLCGYLDGNQNNDLKGRDGTITKTQPNWHIYSRHHDAFSKSWKLKDDENLFKVYKKEFKKWELSNALYCVCEQALEGSAGTTGRVAKAICSPTQYLDCHLTHGSTTSRKCNKVSTHRNARSIQQKSTREIERLMKLAYESDTKPYRIKREEQVHNITESEAEDICGNIINGSMLVTDFSDALVGEDPNAVIDQCMFDVMTGNDESLAGVHADAINTAAKMKFSRDPVFVTNHTETVDTFIKHSCPGNCSQRGQCSNEGECICEEFYHGSDCGIDERTPVIIDYMEGGGLCNITDGDGCECFYIRTHFLLQNFTCAINITTKFIDNTEETVKITPQVGEFEDIFTGLCCVPEERKTRSTTDKIVFSLRYDTAVSNDGLNFGSPEPLNVFNSECQDAVPDTVHEHTIVLKNGFCFIDGMCVQNSEAEISDKCFKCEPYVSKYNWTRSCHPTDSREERLGVILGATFGSIAGIMIVIGIVAIWQFKIKPQQKKKRYVGDSQMFSSTSVEVDNVDHK